MRYQVIRERDAQNRLTAAGFSWPEVSQAWLVAGLFVLGMGTLMAVGAMLNGMFTPYHPYAGPPPAGAGPGLLMMGLGVLLLVVACLRRRTIIFTVEGDILAPQGLPGQIGRDRVGGHHDSIASLENMQMKDEKGVVRLISYGGDTVYLSGQVHRDTALKVAVQLTKALNEIRQAGGSRRGGAQRPRRPPDPDRID
jgi:hypothetical protein